MKMSNRKRTDRIVRGLEELLAAKDNAADLYIKTYFHPYFSQLESNDSVNILRIYAPERRKATVHDDVRKYCHFDEEGKFSIPTKDEILRYSVVVTTLSMSVALFRLGLTGEFSHILIDEAGQALEVEAIMPLSLAKSDTCIVLAGDHKQISPTVYSADAREMKLHVSLLERLFLHYRRKNLHEFNTVFLCRNYRSTEDIVNYLSVAFYQGSSSLLACGKPAELEGYPLNFYSCQGKEVRYEVSSSYYNKAEADEVLQVIWNLVKTNCSLKLDEIGVVSAYAAQTDLIRRTLRENQLGSVTVENITNVQAICIMVLHVCGQAKWVYVSEETGFNQLLSVLHCEQHYQNIACEAISNIA